MRTAFDKSVALRVWRVAFGGVVEAQMSGIRHETISNIYRTKYPILGHIERPSENKGDVVPRIFLITPRPLRGNKVLRTGFKIFSRPPAGNVKRLALRCSFPFDVARSPKNNRCFALMF